MDLHNGVGVSGEEIRPCYAKALRMCSISIASCPLYVEKWSFARSFGVSRTTILRYLSIARFLQEKKALCGSIWFATKLRRSRSTQMLSILTVCRPVVSNFLERIYYDYDNYAGPGASQAILSRCSTTIFIFIERYLASYKPFNTRFQRVAAAREREWG